MPPKQQYNNSKIHVPSMLKSPTNAKLLDPPAETQKPNKALKTTSPNPKDEEMHDRWKLIRKRKEPSSFVSSQNGDVTHHGHQLSPPHCNYKSGSEASNSPSSYKTKIQMPSCYKRFGKL